MTDGNVNRTAIRRPGFRRFRGWWIAAFGGYEYKVSVTGLAFVSSALHDKEPYALT